MVCSLASGWKACRAKFSPAMAMSLQMRSVAFMRVSGLYTSSKIKFGAVGQFDDRVGREEAVALALVEQRALEALDQLLVRAELALQRPRDQVHIAGRVAVDEQVRLVRAVVLDLGVGPGGGPAVAALGEVQVAVLVGDEADDGAGGDQGLGHGGSPVGSGHLADLDRARV